VQQLSKEMNTTYIELAGNKNLNKKYNNKILLDMKMKLLLLSLLFFSITSFSQNYSFSKLVIRANVETSSGNEQRVIETKQGTFKFKFEKSGVNNKTLFTILNPGMNYNPDYYNLIEEKGYVEKNNILFERGFYYSTEYETGVIVLIAKDKSIIVIFKPNNIVEEYLR